MPRSTDYAPTAFGKTRELQATKAAHLTGIWPSAPVAGEADVHVVDSMTSPNPVQTRLLAPRSEVQLRLAGLAGWDRRGCCSSAGCGTESQGDAASLEELHTELHGCSSWFRKLSVVAPPTSK